MKENERRMYVQIAYPLVGDQEIKAHRGLKPDICWREYGRMAWAAFAVSQLLTYVKNVE
jgi:hypothetical protein